MAFTVQQDDPVADANAYVTVQEFKDYHKDRGNNIGTVGSTDIQRAIVRASDYLDIRFTYVGDRKQTDQTMEWPRLDAFDREEILVTGVPDEVKEATSEYALISLNQALNPTPTRSTTGLVVQSTKEKVGPIEEAVTYQAGGVTDIPKYPVADRKLIRRGLTVSTREVIRG